MQALGGAKNHMVVLPDADLDLAADAAVSAGFGSAGERCMAVSVLVAVGPVADDLVGQDRRAGSRRCGSGRAATSGPRWARWSPRAHRDQVASYLDSGVPEGATLAVDGRVHPVIGGAGDGFWLGPERARPRHPADGLLHRRDLRPGAVGGAGRRPTTRRSRLVNDNPYGNGVAIFTNDGGAARRFVSEVEVGMVGVNVPIPVPMAYYSFGGWKASLFGDTHMHGTDGVHFYTRAKVVTSRWLDPSHGGVSLGFPVNK